MSFISSNLEIEDHLNRAKIHEIISRQGWESPICLRELLGI